MRIHEAIRKTHNTVTTIYGNTENDIVALDNNNNEVTINWSQVNNYLNSNQYKTDRERAYPSLQEQFDMMYHDQVNGTTTWKDAITKVKTDNPKES